MRSLVTAHNGPRTPRSPGRRPRTHLQASVQGATVKLSIEQKNERVGGGVRSQITEFSRQSRNRLLRLVGSINRKHYSFDQVLFVTLTYHHNWPEDPAEQYDQLRAWHKRMERRYGDLPIIWRKEWQDRGAPHWHLILFTPAEIAPQEGEDWEFVTAATDAWVDLVAREGDKRHWMLIKSVDVRVTSSWKGAMAYAAKHMRYISKREAVQPRREDGSPLPTGRLWGTLKRQRLPITHETHRVSFSEYLRLRRWFRRLSRPRNRRHLLRKRPQHHLQNVYVLLDYDELNRLLAWLGIIGTTSGGSSDAREVAGVVPLAEGRRAGSAPATSAVASCPPLP